MLYMVSIAHHENFPDFEISKIEEKLNSLDYFSLGGLNGFIFNEELTEKGLFNYLIGDLHPDHLEYLVIQIFNKMPSIKYYPIEVVNWMDERKIKY